MNKNTYVTIMAGGIGSRFWPLSRTHKPKQFLDVLGIGKSLLQLTVDRFLSQFPKENIFILTNANYVEQTLEQLPMLNANQIIAEPLRKNTAPCIAYSAFKFQHLDPNGVMIVAPADHLILETDMFNAVINEGARFAKENDALLTLGIQPTRPDTGYGYIQFVDGQQGNIKQVKTFTEKPNAELAQTFLDSGDFLWNAGIFIWSVKSIIKAFEQHQPDIFEIFNDGHGKYNTVEEGEFLKNAFRLCPNISIDYGVMERAENVFVIPSRFSWSDLGTWASLYSNKVKDGNENVTNGEIVLRDSHGCMVYEQNQNKLILTQGIKDLIIIDTDDVLMVCKRDDEQKVKDAVSELSNKGFDSFL